MTLPIERQSSTWRALKRHLLARIADLQVSLEADLDPVATAAVRGRVQELRLLIERVDPAASDQPKITPSGVSAY